MNGLGQVDFRAAPVPQYDGFGVRVWIRVPGQRKVVTEVALTVGEVESGVQIEPTFEFLPEEAQSLMDALWYAGVRPGNGEGSTGQLAATERHLEDMRTLVFKPVAL